MSSGQNSYIKTHPEFARIAKEVGRPAAIYIHAEYAALLKCDWKKAHRIFVARYGKDGRPLLSKPCSICMKAIELAGIKEIEWTVGA